MGQFGEIVFRPFNRRIFAGISAGAIVSVATLLQPAAVQANEAATPLANADDPLQLVVSIDEQRLELYRGATLVTSSPISSGKRGHSTPRGVFSILEKRRHHFSNLYDDAPMPYMQRLTWSGVALHQGRLPGYPASHGCIRMPRSTASELFSTTSRGMHVVITREKFAPVPFSHPILPEAAIVIAARTDQRSADKALQSALLRTASLDGDQDLAGVALRAELEVATIEAPAKETLQPKSDKPLRILISPRTGRERIREIQHVLTMIGQEPGPIDGLMGRKTRAAIKAFQARTGLPVDGEPTVGFELALYRAFGQPDRPTGHLYVRQGFKPVFDAPVHISGGETPLGTHVYTAQDFGTGSPSVRWTALTAEAAEGASPKAALDRIKLPEHVRLKLQELLTPGSSIIVSDRGISRETGRGTDFIVLTR